MVKVTYLSLKAPHVGHLVWLRALKALGHEVKVASIYDLRRAFLSHGDILVTEGVRSTVFGSLQRVFYRCWASVVCSPSILNPLISELLTLPDLVVAVSSLVRDLVKNKAVVLYPTPPELEALLNIEVTYDIKKPWICFSGAFIPIKGAHLVPEIAYKLKKEGVRASFILAGGTEREPLGRLITSRARMLGVEDYIKIVGTLPRIEIFKLLSNCSIYLQPSLFDSFPISVIEAMVLGAVPVITKYVGSRDLVMLVNESLIREPNPEDIARALISLLTDFRLLKEYSNLSKTVVKEALSFKSTLDRVRDFVETCLSRRDRYEHA
jgi:glycosyltransferase involved in cell wall biosynthesis